MITALVGGGIAADGTGMALIGVAALVVIANALMRLGLPIATEDALQATGGLRRPSARIGTRRSSALWASPLSPGRGPLSGLPPAER